MVSDSPRLLVTRQELLAQGMTRSGIADLVAMGALAAVPGRRSLFVRPASGGWSEPLASALAAAGPRAFAYRRSAAALHGLDAFGKGEDGYATVPEVAVARCRHRRPGVHRIATLAPGEVVAIGGWRTTSVARTLVDIGRVVSPDLVERAVESALRRGLVGEAELCDPLLTDGRWGGPALRAVMARRPVGAPPTESDAETLFVQLCRKGQLPEPERQVPVLIGRRFRLDFAWTAWRVAVEIDGEVAHGPDRRGADLRRQNRLLLDGWLLLRFTWEDVRRYGDEVIATVERALAVAQVAHL